MVIWRLRARRSERALYVVPEQSYDYKSRLEEVHCRQFHGRGVPKSTVYKIIKQYLARGTFERCRGSGRPAKIMTSINKQWLKRIVNHKTGVSQRALASKFSCDQSYICRLIKKLKITYRRRMKVPKYKDDDAKREARKRCRLMTRSISACQDSKFRQIETTTCQTSPVLRWQ